jgi:hypothetical protein
MALHSVCLLCERIKRYWYMTPESRNKRRETANVRQQLGKHVLAATEYANSNRSIGGSVPCAFPGESRLCLGLWVVVVSHRGPHLLSTE